MAARLTDGCMMNDPYRLNSGPAKTAGLFFSLLSVFPAGLRQPRAAGAPIIDSPSTRLQPTGLLPDPSRIRRLRIRSAQTPCPPTQARHSSRQRMGQSLTRGGPNRL
jgi:hypothetical protein